MDQTPHQRGQRLRCRSVESGDDKQRTRQRGHCRAYTQWWYMSIAVIVLVASVTHVVSVTYKARHSIMVTAKITATFDLHYLASPEGSDTSPEGSDTSPEGSDISPDGSYTSPDGSDTSPDRSETSL